MMTEYTVELPPKQLPLTEAQLSCIYRRVMPFTNASGMNKTLRELLAECYLQGMRDALDAQGKLPRD